jgi:alkylation response protein AidB-like acyl-CoA dehydrogenase
MEFGLSEEQTLLVDSTKRFLSDQVSLDVVRAIAAGEKTDAAVWSGLTDLGIPALLVPEDAGGVGLKAIDAAVVAEALAYHVTPGPFVPTATMAVTALANSPRSDLLGEIAAGNLRIGIGFGEAIGARDKASITASGDALSGTAIFVFDSDADHYLIATTDGKVYLVDATAAMKQNLTTIDKTRSTCELVLKKNPAALISDDPEVFNRVLDIGRIMLAADTLGAAQNMIDQAVAYAKDREQFDRPIATFQAVKHMCAEMAASLEPCRSFVWYAAHAFDELPDESRLLACHAKAHVSEVGKFVAKTSTEVHGGMGFTDLVGLHYWFKRIGFNRQMLGAPEYLREQAAKIQGLAA